ncbi:MAG TPA: dihydrolipoyl dehydrogenase [Verrucomicrobiae bacterium]|nr:dihydrolipoyl dehydrogenase [Verrucomicrobiae bacterium]
MSEFDIVILGAGTGGYSAALRAAGLGLSTCLVERDLVGGTCLHRGCIPTKAMLHAAELVDGIRDGQERWGIRATLEGVDVPQVLRTRDDVVQRNFRGLEQHLAGAGVTLVRGDGRLRDARTVAVGGDQVQTARRAVVLATGSVPRRIAGLEVDGERVLTSDEALRLERVPRSAIVLGAGSVGVEFASLWRSFGAEVTLVEALGAVLPLEDPDVSRELARALRQRGLQIRVDTRCESVASDENGVRVTVSHLGETEVLEAELLLVAVGRDPVTQDLGLEAAGVRLDRGYVVPRDWSTLETDVAGIYAVGDILPPPSLALAHASFAEGMLVAELIAGVRSAPIDYDGVPRATYSSPEVASVGLTEPAARERGLTVVTNRMPFGGVAKGLILGQGGFAKVVAEKDGAVLGVHLVGARVTEMISEAMLITNWEADPADVAQLIHPHPTLSEALGEAHLTLAGRPLHQAVPASRRAPAPAGTA